MGKILIAFVMGLSSVPIFLVIGAPLMYYYDIVDEATTGALATFAVMAPYFFICQFFLSRGNPSAIFKDLHLMLALDTVILIMLISLAVSEGLETILHEGLGAIIFCFGGTLAGAFAASKEAQKKEMKAN